MTHYLVKVILQNKDFELFTEYISNINLNKNINRRDMREYNVHACEWNNWDVYKTLLDRGFIIFLDNCGNYDYDMLDRIFIHKCYEIFENLIQYKYIPKTEIPDYIIHKIRRSINGIYPDFLGKNIDKEFLKKIIDNYIDITTNTKFISLVFSDNNSSSGLFNYLIDRDVNINYTLVEYDSRGNQANNTNALFDVIKSGKIDRIEKVIAEGFDLDKITYNIVEYSIKRSNHDIVKYLVSNIDQYNKLLKYNDKLIVAYKEKDIDRFINIFEDSDDNFKTNMNICLLVINSSEFYKFIIDQLCNRKFDSEIIKIIIIRNIDSASYFFTTNRFIEVSDYFVFYLYKKDIDMPMKYNYNDFSPDFIENMLDNYIIKAYHNKIYDEINIIITNFKNVLNNKICLNICNLATYDINYMLLDILDDIGFDFTEIILLLNISKSIDDIKNMINYIVEKGYDINKKSNIGKDCIYYMFERLLQYCHGDIINFQKEWVEDNLKKSFQIIQYVVNIGYKMDTNIDMLIRIALYSENLEFIEYVMDNGATVNNLKYFSRNILCKNTYILKLLVNNKFKVPDDFLAYAVYNNLVSIVEYLISEGTEVSNDIIYLAKIIGNPQILHIFDNYAT